MLTLTTNNAIVLDTLLYDAFGGLEAYVSLIKGDVPLQRLLRSNEDFYITKAWNTELDLVALGLKPNERIVVYDENYNEVANYNHNQYWGQKEEHIQFINSLKNGEQYFLNLNTIKGSKLVLCIAANRLPDFKKKRLIQSWIQQIEWDVFKPVSSEAFLGLLGSHDIVMYYLPINYSTGVTLNQVLASPDAQKFEFSIQDTLVLLSIKKGFYAIGKQIGTFIEWLRIENIQGTEAGSYVFQNGVNYLGRGLTNNLSINISAIGQQVNDIQPTSISFSITGDLEPGFTSIFESFIFSNYIPTAAFGTTINNLVGVNQNLAETIGGITEAVTTSTASVTFVNINMAESHVPIATFTTGIDDRGVTTSLAETIGGITETITTSIIDREVIINLAVEVPGTATETTSNVTLGTQNNNEAHSQSFTETFGTSVGTIVESNTTLSEVIGGTTETIAFTIGTIVEVNTTLAEDIGGTTETITTSIGT